MVGGLKLSEEPRGPFFITEPPTHKQFSNTEGATIDCTAFGQPAPELDWISNGKPVDNIPGILRILPNNTLYLMPFSDVQLKPEVHSASYQCTAKNSAGTIVSRTMKVKAGKWIMGNNISRTTIHNLKGKRMIYAGKKKMKLFSEIPKKIALFRGLKTF